MGGGRRAGGATVLDPIDGKDEVEETHIMITRTR